MTFSLKALMVILLAIMPGISNADEKVLPKMPDPRAHVFSSEFPYESKFMEVLGSKMHYIDEGSGDPILFLHGNPTSMYLWRNVIPYVAPLGRVVAVDNIGFGKSDKPDLDYTFQTHRKYLKAFIDKMGLKNVTLVVHDWGSVLGLDYAAHHEDNIKAVVFMESIIPPSYPKANYGEFNPVVAKMFRAFRDPVQGRKLLIEENAFIEKILANATVTRRMTKAEIDAYRAPFIDPESRFPIFVFPNELPIEGKPERNVSVIENIGEWLKVSNTPKLLLYASPGAIISPKDAAWMAQNYRNIITQFVGYGTHFIQEDNPEVIGRSIADWYRRLQKSTN